ncbi:MAG: hypothetical protein WCM76_09060 [Bacteroidota bacterium]
MKKVIIALSGLLIITCALLLFFILSNTDSNACQIQAQKNMQQLPEIKIDSVYLICEGHVGKIEINMDVANLEKLFRKENIEEKNVSNEGIDSKMYYITVDGKPDALIIEPICTDICEVSRIFIHSTKYKTKDGIGVGSTFGELKKVYTIQSLTGNEDGGIFVYAEQLSQIAFEVKPADLKTHPGKVHTVLEVPDNTPVSMIYMY